MKLYKMKDFYIRKMGEGRHQRKIKNNFRQRHLSLEEGNWIYHSYYLINNQETQAIFGVKF